MKTDAPIYTTNHYSQHGYLEEVKDMDDRSIWKAETINAEGQLLQVKKGAKTTTYNYDNMGLPETIQCGGIINHHYVFGEDGNLTSREDLLSHQKEVFSYTTDNQLKGWQLFRNGTSVNDFLPSGDARKIHYLSGGNGVAGIYVEEESSRSSYYAYTDYLSSLTTSMRTLALKSDNAIKAISRINPDSRSKERIGG